MKNSDEEFGEVSDAVFEGFCKDTDSDTEKDIVDFDELPQGDLSLAMEIYCQQRAMGKTKTRSVLVAYPKSKHPAKHGHLLEKDLRVKNRIRELKDEREEVYNLDKAEQIRKYHEVYEMAIAMGKLPVAVKALERIDAIGGFEVKKSENVRINKTDAFGLDGDNFEQAKKKFSGILGFDNKDLN